MYYLDFIFFFTGSLLVLPLFFFDIVLSSGRYSNVLLKKTQDWIYEPLILSVSVYILFYSFVQASFRY